MSETATPRRKRSSTLKLTTMLAGAASLTLNGCDSPAQAPAPGTAEWTEAQIARSEPVQAFAYASLDACKTADEVPDAECDRAFAAAQADETNAPRYDDRTTCEEVYGAGNCVPRSTTSGSFFTPLLTGFVIGQMLDMDGRRYYRGTGLYHRRDEYGGGGYYTGWGGRLDHNYSTGRYEMRRYGLEPTPQMRQAPPKVQTRTSVVSRGGFGGGSRGYGGRSYGG